MSQPTAGRYFCAEKMLAAGMKARIDRGSAKAAVGLACAALLACLAAPSFAAAATWTVNGRGFGHGVGMSQYGAYGYALHGRDHRFILGHYYQGTSIGRAPRKNVRVLLTIADGDVKFKQARSACGRRLNRTRLYRARRHGDGVRLLSSSGRVLADCGKRMRAKGKGRVRIRGNGAYRGALVVVPTSSGDTLNVINSLSIDKYVRGVIAGEMPSSWPIEALKVQAVAARSYALAGRIDGNGFHLYDDTRSQVYDGIAGETRRTNRAVRRTKRQVVMYGDEVATTYYSASSGGQTENVEFGFGGGDPSPYLKSVADPYDNTSPLHSWRRSFSQGEMESRLGRYLKGNLQDIQVTRTGVSPRIVSANLVGSGGTTKVSGSTLQSALGLYSTWMSFNRSG
ncbi:MAG: SpoIID/LytB domain-containing protein [Solirubrobacterales bacterium]